jgi:hypothetical protein
MGFQVSPIDAPSRTSKVFLIFVPSQISDCRALAFFVVRKRASGWAGESECVRQDGESDLDFWLG